MENEKHFSPLKAIRKNCLECCSDSANEVKLCPCDGIQSTRCYLHYYRSGKRPAGSNKRILTDAQRQVMSERMKKNLEKMKMAKAAKSAVTDPV